MSEKLTANMLKVLRNVAAGKSVTYGTVGRSQSGGLAGTIMALHRRGMFDPQGCLTAKAQEALAAEDAK